MNWFSLSFIGWIVLIIALAIAAFMTHAIPTVWIAVGVLALIGVGMIVSVKNSKPRI